MKKRTWFLFSVFTLIIIFLMYKLFMPHEPKLMPVNSDFLSELTIELRANYPEVDKIDGRIFRNVLELDVAYKGVLEDLKAQEILKVVKNNIYEKDISESKYDSISVSIYNMYPPYRYIYSYTTVASLNNNKSAVTRWTVSKTVIIDDKETNSESIFEE